MASTIEEPPVDGAGDCATCRPAVTGAITLIELSRRSTMAMYSIGDLGRREILMMSAVLSLSRQEGTSDPQLVVRL